MPKRNDTSGEIAFVDGAVVFRDSGAGWTVKLADVRLIGVHHGEWPICG